MKSASSSRTNQQDQSQNSHSGNGSAEYYGTTTKVRKMQETMSEEPCHSNSTKVTSTGSAESEQDQQHPMSTNDMSWISQYGIIKAIFQTLPIKDLLSASQVCKHWAEVGKVVRAKRRNVAHTILYHPYSEQGRTKEAVEYFNDVQISNEVNVLMSEIEPSFIDILRGDWSKEIVKEWTTCFKRDFLGQFSESEMILLFATKSFSDFIQTLKKKWSLKTEQQALFGQDIPTSVPCVSAFGYGLALTLPNSSAVYEMERAELPMVCGLVVPKVPGLRMKLISFDKETIQQKYRRRRSVNSSNCMEILGISPQEKVKGLIILDADSYGRYTNPFMDAVFHYIKDHPTVCLAGGNVHYTLTNKSKEEMNKQLGFGVMICGNDDDTVKVGTVGLFDEGMSIENENKLKKFQNLVRNGESSFAFMFACNGRGAQMHKNEHVEVTLFRKYYPNTPIIGIFTGGELANEYLPGEIPNPPTTRGSLEFTFSTVFLFISFKQAELKLKA